MSLKNRHKVHALGEPEERLAEGDLVIVLDLSKAMPYFIAIVVLAIVSGGIAVGVGQWRQHKVDLKNQAITAEVQREESGEQAIKPAVMSEADRYVNDFKYIQDVSLSADGFKPDKVSVKPQTKVVFKSGDGKEYVIGLADGSPAPKYYNPDTKLSLHALVQYKFETAGTYTFIVGVRPENKLTITVE